jgi:hypothetical protein
MKSALIALRQRKHDLAAKARAILDRAKTEARTLTDAEGAEHSNILALLNENEAGLSERSSNSNRSALRQAFPMRMPSSRDSPEPITLALASTSSKAEAVSKLCRHDGSTQTCSGGNPPRAAFEPLVSS